MKSGSTFKIPRNVGGNGYWSILIPKELNQVMTLKCAVMCSRTLGGQSSCCSLRVEAQQQSSPCELYWSSGVPSQSLSRTLGGQSHKIKKNSQIHNFHESR